MILLLRLLIDWLIDFLSAAFGRNISDIDIKFFGGQIVAYSSQDKWDFGIRAYSAFTLIVVYSC